MFDKAYYESKLAKVKARSDRTVQEYVNAGIKFGQDVADLNNETKEVQQLIAEATAKEGPKEVIAKEPKKYDKTPIVR